MISADGRSPVQFATDVLVQGAEFDAANVADADDPPAGRGAKNDVRELLRLLQAAERGQGDLRRLAAWGRLLPDLSASHLRVLLADGQDDVVGGEVVDGQPVGVEPNPHAVIALAAEKNVADSLQAEQLVFRPASARSCSSRAGRSGRASC